MDLPRFMGRQGHSVQVRAVDMHTCGEPTRIVYDGFPDTHGSLLKQRDDALRDHDRIRQALLREPRGHPDMYGAVIRLQTELTAATPRVDLGVLFLTNGGYSTMCGHATLAIGRLIADHVGSRSHQLLPAGHLDNLEYDLDYKQEAYLSLHVPCGVVHVTIPIIAVDARPALPRWKSDLTRPISYTSVASFVTGVSVSIPVPKTERWTELQDKDHIIVDIVYGGAFYVIVDLEELGFNHDIFVAKPPRFLPRLIEASNVVKALVNSIDRKRDDHDKFLRHPEHRELEELYGIIVTGKSWLKDTSHRADGMAVCIFANSQVDRSPTGSGVQARVALAFAKGELGLNESRVYHSIVSHAFGGQDPFTGTAVEEVDAGGGRKGVVVKVSGYARYTGCSTFIVERDDKIGEGFEFNELKFGHHGR